MIKIVHPVAGGIALLVIVTFWLATLLSELFGSSQMIVAVKTTIPWGLLLLIPALAATGGTGFKLSRGRRPRLISMKIRRTAVSAANGLAILVPLALFLAHKVRVGELDAAFYAAQALELFSGAVNITLLGLNMRDGFTMKGRFRHPIPTQPNINKGL